MGGMMGGGAEGAATEGAATSAATDAAATNAATDSMAPADYTTSAKVSPVSSSANSMIDRPEFSDLKNSGIEQPLAAENTAVPQRGEVSQFAMQRLKSGGGGGASTPYAPQYNFPVAEVDASGNAQSSTPQYSALMEYLRAQR